MKNFSYFIPEKMDKPSVPTVFNQSLPYATFEVARRVTNYLQSKSAGGKKKPPTTTTSITPNGDSDPDGGTDTNAAADPSSMSWKATTAQDIVYPYSKRPVLKDINLVLKPGNTYLVLGPPSCGKTSLLKAIADRLSYKGRTETDSVPNQPHLEGRIEYNNVACTVRRYFACCFVFFVRHSTLSIRQLLLLLFCTGP